VFAVVSLFGCGVDHQGSSQPTDGAAQAVTWNHDIAPLVSDKCLGCHVAGGIAPFSMESYAQAKPFAAQMAQAVEDGRMPPFLARDTADCKPRLPWLNDPRLSSAEQKLLRSWADAKAPEGTGEALKQSAKQLAALSREDVSMKLPDAISVSGQTDLHTCLLLDPGLSEDGYVIGRGLKAGNHAVLHHVVAYLVQPGKNMDGTDRSKEQLEAAIMAEKHIGIGGRYDCFGGTGLTSVSVELLDAWAPGGVPNLAPEDSGQPIDKDALVLLDMHYHPTGAGEEVDTETTFSLMLAEEKPAFVSKILLLGNTSKHRETGSGTADLLQQPDESEPAFVIPPNEAAHVEEMTWQWKLPPVDVRLYATGTHMHYVGRDMRITVDRPEPSDDDPAHECLIETPNWDFNWQRAYQYDADREQLPKLHTGDVLHLRCQYDNTLQNAALARALDARGLGAPIEVKLGEDTLDEMCIGMVGLEYPNL
jgi:hypothetical protein